MDTAALFDRAMAAIKADKHTEARDLLIQVVTANPQHEEGWLWLAGVIDDLDKAIDCLERVLRLNPNNAKAKEWLKFAQKEKEKEAAQGVSLEEPGDAERAVGRLGRYLLQSKFITPDQLKRALQAQRDSEKQGITKRLGIILVEQGAITEERLSFALREQREDFDIQFKD
jgi:tetratricopeptide (TPR) repeat protein